MKKIALFLFLASSFQIFVGSQYMTIISPYKTERQATSVSLYFVLPPHFQSPEVDLAVNDATRSVAFVTSGYIAKIMTEVRCCDYPTITFERDGEYGKVMCSHKLMEHTKNEAL